MCSIRSNGVLVKIASGKVIGQNDIQIPVRTLPARVDQAPISIAEVNTRQGVIKLNLLKQIPLQALCVRNVQQTLVDYPGIHCVDLVRCQQKGIQMLLDAVGDFFLQTVGNIINRPQAVLIGNRSDQSGNQDDLDHKRNNQHILQRNFGGFRFISCSYQLICSRLIFQQKTVRPLLCIQEIIFQT